MIKSFGINKLGIGIGLDIGRKDGWTPATIASKILFWGKYSEITGGQMPNKITGLSDYLTVAGSAGSETYQAPHNATYEAADTDYIWFRGDSTQRTPSTAELIGYDLQRTPVKFDDDITGAIREVIILNGTALTSNERDHLFAYMELSVFWDGIANDFGHQKESRSTIDKILWIPELTPAAILSDGDTTGQYISSDLTTITKDVNDFVSSFRDKLGSGHNFTMAIALNQPKWYLNDGILFDGINSYLRYDFAPELNYSYTIYLVFKIISQQTDDVKYITYNSNGGMQLFTNQNYTIKWGVLNPLVNINNYAIITLKGSVGMTSIRINQSNPIVGTDSDKKLGIFCIGGAYFGTRRSNIQLKELIIRKTIDSTDEESCLNTYLKNKYSL